MVRKYSFDRAADAVVGNIRRGMRQRDGPVQCAGIDLHADGIAAAECIFLLDTGIECQFLILRIAAPR